jgi:hypothetical protein
MTLDIIIVTFVIPFKSDSLRYFEPWLSTKQPADVTTRAVA